MRSAKTARAMTGLLLAVVLAAGAGLLGAAPAVAHAALVGTDPEDGATVQTLPRELTFEFNEPIGGTPEVAVTGPDGELVPVEDLQAIDREVRATIAPGTLAGEYVLAYRVVSADGHPIAGQVAVTVTEGEAAADVAPSEDTSATPAQEEQVQQGFVHRHREHLLWGGLVALVALALIVVPLVRRNRA